MILLFAGTLLLPAQCVAKTAGKFFWLVGTATAVKQLKSDKSAQFVFSGTLFLSDCRELANQQGIDCQESEWEKLSQVKVDLTQASTFYVNGSAIKSVKVELDRHAAKKSKFVAYLKRPQLSFSAEGKIVGIQADVSHLNDDGWAQPPTRLEK